MRLIASAVAVVAVAATAWGVRPSFQAELDVTNTVAAVDGAAYRISGKVTDRSVMGYDGTSVAASNLVFSETITGDVDAWQVTNVVASNAVHVTLDVVYQPAGETNLTLEFPAGPAALCTVSATATTGYPQPPSETGAALSAHMLNEIRNYSFRLVPSVGSAQDVGLGELVTNVMDNVAFISNAAPFGATIAAGAADGVTRSGTNLVITWNTNAAGGGTGDASLWYQSPARDRVTFDPIVETNIYFGAATYNQAEYDIIIGTNEWTDTVKVLAVDDDPAVLALEPYQVGKLIATTNYTLIGGTGAYVSAITVHSRYEGNGDGMDAYLLMRWGATNWQNAPLVGYHVPLAAYEDYSDTYTFAAPFSRNDFADLEVGLYVANGGLNGATCRVDAIYVTLVGADAWDMGVESDGDFTLASGGTTRLSVSTGGTVTATGDVIGNGIPLSAAVTGVVVAAGGANSATVAGGVATVTWNTNDAGGGGGWSGGAIVNPSSFSGGLTVTNGAAALTTNAPMIISTATPYTEGLKIKLSMISDTNLWTPALLTNSVVAWFEADNVSNTYADGAAMTNWANKAGGFPIVPNTSPPKMKYGALNGHCGVAFNSNWAFTASIVVDQPYMFFTVMEITNILATAETIMDSTSGSHHYLYRTSSGWLFDSSILTYQPDNGIGPRVMWGLANKAASELSVAGTNKATYDFGTTNRLNGFIMGANQTAATPFLGYVCEFLIVSNALSATERDRVCGYLAHKYGLQSQLVTNSAYLLAAPSIGDVFESTNALVVQDSAGANVATIDQDGNITGNGVSLTTLKGQFDASSNRVVAISATATNQLNYADGASVPINYHLLDRQDGGTWDGTNWTPGIVGWTTINASYNFNQFGGSVAARVFVRLYKNGVLFRDTPVIQQVAHTAHGMIGSWLFYNDIATNIYQVHALQISGVGATNSSSAAQNYIGGMVRSP